MEASVPNHAQPMPGEDRAATSFDTARRWLTIYEQREALLAADEGPGLSEEEVSAIAAGAVFWRRRLLELSGLDLDGDRRVLRLPTGEEVTLTRRELELLEFLVQHTGRHFPDRVLAARAWGEKLSGDQVRIYIGRLREKLAGSGWEVTSRRGYGYALNREMRHAAGDGEAKAGPTVSPDAMEQALGRMRGLVVAHQLQLEVTLATARKVRARLRESAEAGGGGGS